MSVDYSAINEEFGEGSSNEDLAIENDQIEKASKGDFQSKFIINIGQDYSKNKPDAFPNYFKANQKGNSGFKISDEETERGKKELLLKKEQAKPKTGKQFQSDYEDSKRRGRRDADGDEEMEEVAATKDEAVVEILEDDQQKHAQQRAQLRKKNKSNFAKMKHYLYCGFNLLVYGVGSKRNFLNEFALDKLSDEPILVVNGYHSATNMKTVVNPMLQFAAKRNFKHADRKNVSMSIHDQVEAIKRIFDCLDREETMFNKYHLLIHSMDAGALKNDDYQRYLSQIACVRGVALIVSVDHIKAGMIWSEQMLDRFNFIAVEANTFEDFDVELEYHSPLFSFKNDNQEVGLKFVLKSMTQTQQKIIRIIANHMLTHPTEKGVSLKDLLDECVEQMVAYSQKGIKDLMHEAVDHKVVLERTDEQGHQMYSMSYPVGLLEKIANDDLK